MTQQRKKLGEQGETIALEFLKKKQFKILAQNYRCRFGEVDIIARDKKTFVFIEVKTRTSLFYGTPQEAVNSRKQAQLSRVALEFIQRYNLQKHQARFDVVAITLQPTGCTVNYIQNAFEVNFC